jgi:phage host-nuclease inhibitor protein Gam
MGVLYNPSNANLQYGNLDQIKADLARVMTDLNDKKPAYKNAVANRELKIAPLAKLTTQVLNFAKSTSISATAKENLQNQVKKIRGDAKAKSVNPDTAEGNSISTIQMSYDSRIANLEAFITQLASHPEYTPNEVNIQIGSLQVFCEELKILSSQVNSAGNALITARKNRNDALYNNTINAIQTIKEMKAYVKSLGTTAEPYYKALTKLKFVNRL